MNTSFFTGFSHKSENEIHEQAQNQQNLPEILPMAKNGLKSEECSLVADLFRVQLNISD